MTTRQAGMIAAPLAALALALGARARPAPAGPQEPTRAELEAKIKALEGLIPDQAHIMADVGDHFTNLWFAGQAGNWPLADFYLAETKSHLRWAVRRIPVRKDSRGQEIHLGNILEAFENGPLAALKNPVDGKDKAGFGRVYREVLTACYACHKAADKPFLRPQIPAEPGSRVMNFDPKADWPL